jgi:hypothetical protein
METPQEAEETEEESRKDEMDDNQERLARTARNGKANTRIASETLLRKLDMSVTGEHRNTEHGYIRGRRRRSHHRLISTGDSPIIQSINIPRRNATPCIISDR